jgi:hypothetical protein
MMEGCLVMIALQRKCLRNVLIWGGNCISLWIWLFYYDSIQGFYTTLWVPYESILFAYLQREWKDGHTKIRQRGIKGSEDKGNERTGIREWRNDSGHIPLYKGNRRMRLRHVVAYWVRSGPPWVLAPSGYFCWSPSFPTRSVFIQIFIPDCGNGAIG